jgi:BirA family transcriptional regulator, biotin operon repressor / biotin---[acetyl-CoA-carboxylase] ligase
MLSQHVLDELRTAAKWPVPIRYVESTGSTNDDLMTAGDAGAPAWTVLVADHQTAGRGRLGRSWEAPPGSSLLVSVLLRPAIRPSEAPILSLFSAITLLQAIEESSGLSVSCEWPNDLVTREGRKLGGVLLESRIEGGRLLHVVIGVGVNLTQTLDDFPDDVRLPPTSLVLEGADPAPFPEGILWMYLFRLRQRLDLDHEYFVPWVAQTYSNWCATVGRRVRATTVDGAVVEGTATDVDATGALVLETADGEARVAFGELERLG